MKSKRSFIDSLQDILTEIERIEQFVKGIDLTQFKKDEKTIHAVIRALEVIGEASKNIPKTVKNKYPEVPWREMAGFRDKLIHHYFGMNVTVVWKSVKEDMLILKPTILKVFDKEK